MKTAKSFVFCLVGALAGLVASAAEPPHASSCCFPDGVYSPERCRGMAEEAGRRVEEFRKRFAALRVRAAEAFELSADSLQAERFGKRMRMAERTCEFVLREARRGTGDGCGFAERGLADLDVFAESFEDELRLWADNPQNPKVKATGGRRSSTSAA